MSDQKTRAIERAQKLLALASPGSGTTEAERTNAALEAAKLIAEHGLAVATPPPKPRRKRSSSSGSPSTTYSPRSYHAHAPVSYGPEWIEVINDSLRRCVICNEVITIGEAMFFHAQHGVRHYDITCDVPQR